MQAIPLAEMATRLGCALRGDGELKISGVAGLEQAGPSELTFLANKKYSPKLKTTRAGAVLVGAEVSGLSCAQLISSNPYLDFARALEMFYQPPRPAAGIHPQAAIARTAKIGDNA